MPLIILTLLVLLPLAAPSAECSWDPGPSAYVREHRDGKFWSREGFALDTNGERVRHGIYEVSNQEGQLIMRAHFCRGEYQGLLERWDDDGTPRARENYHQGRLSDSVTFWNSNGKLSQKDFFVAGTAAWTANWHPNGIKTFERQVLHDSVFRTTRWDTLGNKTKEFIDTGFFRPKKMVMPANDSDSHRMECP